MRARSIKPGFFKNEVLAELDPLCRILFEGLWCLADREGRLKDRPKRIKAEVLPYDDCDVDGFLDALHRSGFIARYRVGGERYIQIRKFLRHQSPHYKEKESEIPPPPPPSDSKLESKSSQACPDDNPSMDQSCAKHEPSMTTQPGRLGSSMTTQASSDRSDSGLLTPDSGLLTPDKHASAKHGAGGKRDRIKKPSAKDRREAMFREIQEHFYPHAFDRHLSGEITGRRAYAKDLKDHQAYGFPNEQAMHSHICVVIERAKQSPLWQKAGDDGPGQYIPGIGKFFKERLWRGSFGGQGEPGPLSSVGRQAAQNAAKAMVLMKGEANARPH